MFWQEQDQETAPYKIPDDVFDLLFGLTGKCIAIDHAWPLAMEVTKRIPARYHDSIGIHQIRVAESGNGWNRPDRSDDLMHLSRRTKLVLRIHKSSYDDVSQLTGNVLKVGDNELLVGQCKIRPLSKMKTLFSRGIVSNQDQSESDFLADVASELLEMKILVEKMICGTSRVIKNGSGENESNPLFTRSLMIAELTPKDSVTLQQQGIGSNRLLGCGLFVPHKGIEAVYSKQE